MPLSVHSVDMFSLLFSKVMMSGVGDQQQAGKSAIIATSS